MLEVVSEALLQSKVGGFVLVADRKVVSLGRFPAPVCFFVHANRDKRIAETDKKDRILEKLTVRLLRE